MTPEQIDELIRASHARGDLRGLAEALLARLRLTPDRWEFWTDLGLKPRVRTRRLIPALALAASIALLLLIQPGPDSTPDVLAPVAAAPVPGPEWSSEYRLFEQATVAIGSVDPVSKGIVLASLAEAR